MSLLPPPLRKRRKRRKRRRKRKDEEEQEEVEQASFFSEGGSILNIFFIRRVFWKIWPIRGSNFGYFGQLWFILGPILEPWGRWGPLLDPPKIQTAKKFPMISNTRPYWGSFVKHF